MKLSTKQILVVVKAYPSPSKKYGETVCCAGVELETNKWIRLYPIPFRDLDSSQKFKKYSIIKVSCYKAPDDHRVESFKVDSDSINIITHLDTKDNWGERGKIVLPTASSSFCEIHSRAKNNKSLGMFKPYRIDFSWKKIGTAYDRKRESCYSQLSFFNKKKKAIEEIPFDFYYHFKCGNASHCPEHKLPILDWEIGQAYRDWRYNYSSEAVLLQKIKERWLERMCNENNDVYFYVGNMKRFKDQFMVLGVFYPKIKKRS